MFRRPSNRMFKQPVTRLSIDEGRRQALKLLNQREPQHVPDVYFVRRSPSHLVEYLNFDEAKLSKIADKVMDRQKISYNAFRIEPHKDRYLLSRILECKKK